MFTFEYTKSGAYEQYEILHAGQSYGKFLYSVDYRGMMSWRYMLADDNEYTYDLNVEELMEIVNKLKELNKGKIAS